MTTQIRPAPVRKSVTVRAPPERAFEVFTAGMHRWWPGTHHIGASPMKQMILEQRQGGRWYSICEDDSDCDIGHVMAWNPPSHLLLAWQINGAFKYDPDMITEIEVKFTDLGDGTTRVELEHRNLERMGDAAETARAGFESPNGWGKIMALYAEAVG
jgi:uncharacterized protein YndB with AHSA1/START domain